MRWAIKHKSGRTLFVTSDEFIANNRRKMGWIVEEVKMTSREQFEEWVSGTTNSDLHRSIMLCRHENGNYNQLATNHKWEAWQASRAMIEIKLPNQACLATWHYAGCGPDDCYEAIEISRKPSEDKSVDGTEPFPLLTKWEVEQAIESAGLKVKK